MTSAIIEDQEKANEVYQFLEEDDDFEEFEQDYGDIMAECGIDKEMATGADADRNLWKQDWDDEDVDTDFASQLRAQLSKAK